MTTIIFKETKSGNVKVAYDSQVSSGWRKAELGFDKVFVNNGMIFGVAGAVRDANIIKYAPLPSIPDAEWDVDKWVVTTLIPAIAGALSGNYATAFVNQQISTENNILVAVRGRVYKLATDLAMVRYPDSVYAIGSGSDYVYGALAAGASIKNALAVAAELDSFTGQELKLTSAHALLGVK